MTAFRSFAMAALGGAVVFALGYAATSWSVNRKLETAARLVSNTAAKQDRLDPARIALPPVEPVLRREIERLPSGEARVTLVDAAGRVVYRDDPGVGETVVARDAPLPSGIRPKAPEPRSGAVRTAKAPGRAGAVDHMHDFTEQPSGSILAPVR